MESATDLVEYNYKGLASITAGFSKENFIGDTLFGKVFRGKIQQDLETQEVVVKIWVKTTSFASTPDRQKSRLDNEIKLLTYSDLKGHPNLVKLIGFCCETEHLGVVYELKPLDTLEKLIIHDDFTWVARIKVALEFACLLECLHDQQLLHRSISAAHLMVDQALSPRLFDFAMLVGGGFGEICSREHAFGSHGYVDPLISLTGAWSDKTDVFAYGVILLGLIAKRVYDLKNARYLGTLNYVFFWAWTEYNENPSKKTQFKLWGMYKKHKKSQSNKSLVDKGLESDQYFNAGDGVEITKLAMRCVEENPERRPMMKEVVCCLRELNVVKKSSHVVLPKMSVGSSGGDGMESATDLVEYNYEELASITGGFSEENFIGDTLYGKVFRGKIQQGLKTQEVVVKIWVNCRRFATTPELQKSRLDNEIKLLTNSVLKGHPNLVKLIGFCCETERLGVVFELKPLDTLEKLILHDDFAWLARIKVALEFACLLECFHDQQLWHRSIGAAYLMIDQAFSPRLFDFPMLVGGGFGEIRSREYDLGSDGYIDPLIGLTGAWSDKTDVFAFGVVLLGLIAKRVHDLKKGKELGLLSYVHIWAWTECGKPQSKNFRVKDKPQSKLWGMFKKHKESQLIIKSLVDKSLENDEHFDAGDGVEITKLAMRCVDEYPQQRPTMKEVVRCLRELDVVKKFSCFVLPKMSVASSGGVVGYVEV